MDERVTPEKLMDMSRAFMESRILLTAAELDLFTILENPLTATELCERFNWRKRALTVLLDALSAVGLLIKTGRRYQTPPELMPSLSSKSPRTFLPMLKHAANLWQTWSNLTTIVRETGQAQRTPGEFQDPDDLKAFINAMHAVGLPAADRIAGLIGLEKSLSAIDVGGGSGTYTIAMLNANPNLRVTLFDRPDVVKMARERIGEAGLADRVSFAAGDFYEDDLPGGHDTALLSAIIHQNSLDQNLALFKRVFKSLDRGGRIIIRDHIMDPTRTTPRAGALFAVNMLVNTPGGGVYTFEEVATGLNAAGFTNVKLIQDGERMDGLVEAVKP